MTTRAGLADTPGSADGTGGTARFNRPGGVAVDSATNIYVADFSFNTIRKGYPPPILRNSAIIDGQFVSVLSGPPGQLVVVEASSDLQTWLPIWTNTFGAGPLNFSDPKTSEYSIRFYRAPAP